MPNDGDLVDQIAVWVPDEAARQRILVDNPERLYGFERGDAFATHSLHPPLQGRVTEFTAAFEVKSQPRWHDRRSPIFPASRTRSCCHSRATSPATAV